jgi:hypothetical protein
VLVPTYQKSLLIFVPGTGFHTTSEIAEAVIAGLKTPSAATSVKEINFISLLLELKT